MSMGIATLGMVSGASSAEAASQPALTGAGLAGPCVIMSRLEAVIEAVTPTTDAHRPGFVAVRHDEDVTTRVATSNQERWFIVTQAAIEEGSFNAFGVKEMIGAFDVSVLYPMEANEHAQRCRMANDRADIERAIDNSSNWGVDVVQMAVFERPPPTQFASEEGGEIDRWLSTIRVQVRYFEEKA